MTRLQTLDRTLDILETLADGRSRTSQEIADAVGVHRSSVYRILRTLEERGFVARTADGKYGIGLGLVAVSASGLSSSNARLPEILLDLANSCSATALLCIALKDEAVVIASQRPESGLVTLSIRENTRFPLHSSAPGMAILSLFDERSDEADEVTLARTTGYVHISGALFSGLSTIAVPLRLLGDQRASLAIVQSTNALAPNDALAHLTVAQRLIEQPETPWSI